MIAALFAGPYGMFIKWGIIFTLGAALYITGGMRWRDANEAKWQAIESARLNAAQQLQIKHQAGAIGVLNHAATTAPVFVAPAVAADRVRHAVCPSTKLPQPAIPGTAAGPPGTDTTADAETDTGADAQRLQLVDEMRECLKLAHDYETLVPLWHSQEAK